MLSLFKESFRVGYVLSVFLFNTLYSDKEYKCAGGVDEGNVSQRRKNTLEDKKVILEKLTNNHIILKTG